MTVSEYIEKLHEYTKHIGPENEVEVSPIRLMAVMDSKLSETFINMIFKGKISDNN